MISATMSYENQYREVRGNRIAYVDMGEVL
jgi:hypothetical protein